MASIRKRAGKWYFRGTVPALQPSGEIVKVRVERCLGTQSRSDAIKRAADLERYFWNLAHNPPKPTGPSFAQAALLYIETRGRSDRFTHKLIEHFGDTPLNEITQEKAVEAAELLYPGWSGASINRAIFTPLSAIGVKGLKRPAQGKSVLSIPAEGWFDSVISAAPPKLAALIIFLTLTGRRVGEALALTEKDVDERGVAYIGRTKSGTSVSVQIPSLSLALLSNSNLYYARKGVGQPSKRLFGYSSPQAASVALRRTCDRAGVPYYSFHKAGRHSFASRLLRKGYSTKFIATAGGWQSMKSMSRYLHLEHSEVHDALITEQEEWSKRRERSKTD